MSSEHYSEILSCDSLQSIKDVISQLSAERRLQIAKASLQTVLARNFCGLKDSPVHLPSVLSDVAREELSFDLNRPFGQTRALDFLLLAKLSSIDIASIDPLTSFRVALTWQKILDEPAIPLKQIIDVCTSDISSCQLSEDEWAEYWLERSHCHLGYYEYEKSEEAVKKALEHAGLDVELAGQLGKRTKFQQTSVAQLALKTTSVSCCPKQVETDLPTNCQNTDDTLLESVSFDGSTDSRVGLSSVQLCCILALETIEKRSQHNDVILLEKCAAYVDEVISQRRGWSIQTAALMERCDLEKTKSRKVERACSQSEHIVKLMNGIDDTTPESSKWSRLPLLLASSLSPWWKVQVTHADILAALGCISEALLTFEHLEMWDHVIDCYKALQQLEKAEGLIRRLLTERGEDPTLYCLLGDITSEVKYYEKAIELSSDRSARARKFVGLLMLSRKQYEKAYEHLRRSLELQPIQLGVWFNAGYSAWMLDRFADAVSCYHRCVSLEPEHFEAWNNLSAGYIRMGQKDRARRILQEALKYNYEHPGVLENYLYSCVDTGDFAQAIFSYHRLLDLNKPIKDDEVLEIMAKAVLRMENESGDNVPSEIRNVKEDLVKLFARITTQQTLTSMGWRCYAELKKPLDNDITEYEKYIQLLERSLMADSNKPNWVKEESKVESVLESVIVLCDARFKWAEMKGTEEAQKQIHSRIRMSVRQLVTVAEKEYGSLCKDAKSEKIKDWTTAVKEILEKVVV